MQILMAMLLVLGHEEPGRSIFPGEMNPLGTVLRMDATRRSHGCDRRVTGFMSVRRLFTPYAKTAGTIEVCAVVIACRCD